MMKLRKRMKKALSLLLAGAMAVTGVNANIGTVSAEDETNTLHNPRIVEDSSMKSGQKVTWDCVYFGSYPQTEVVSESDMAAINALESHSEYYETEYETIDSSKWAKITGASYDSNGDAVVDGEKYRRIKKADATNSSGSGNGDYKWADSTSYHYFRYEPIKWRVLSVDGQEALLLADQGLDDRRYNESYTDVT